MKKIFILCLLMLLVAGTATAQFYPSGQNDTSPHLLVGRESDGTYTALQVDSDGKVSTSGGGGAFTETAEGAYIDGDVSATGNLLIGGDAQVNGNLTASAVWASELSSVSLSDNARTQLEASLRLAGGTVLSSIIDAQIVDVRDMSYDVATSGDLSVGNNLTVANTLYTENIVFTGTSGEVAIDKSVSIADNLTINDVNMCVDVWEFNVLSPSTVNVSTDPIYIGANYKGQTVTVLEVKAWAVGYDDTAFTVLEKDADGVSNSATVDAVNCTTGSGPYTATETTITGATIEDGHTIWIQLDDTDDPQQLAGYVRYKWYS